MNDKQLDLISLYVLDLLEPAERKALEMAAATDPRLANEIQALQEASAALVYRARPEALPAELKDQILAQLPPKEAESLPKKAGLRTWAKVAAALLLVAGLLVLFTPRTQDPPVIVIPPLAQEILEVEGQTPEYAEVGADVNWLSEENRGWMEVDQLPGLPADQVYQFWILSAQHEAPLPAGIFSHNEAGPAAQPFAVEEEVGENIRVAVSIEPSGGSAQPTGPVVLVSAESQGHKL
ncbi:MAG: anti-sigma factor domain-containing protein [Verrucomicrobiales bacterium]